MSHIHDALKKAQMEREVRSPKYDGVVAGPEKKSSGIRKRTALWWIPLCLIILIAVLTFSWFYFREPPAPLPKAITGKTGSSKPKTGKGPNGNVQKLFFKAKTLQKSGRLQEAENWYKKAVEIDPGYVPALNNLGVVYLHEGKIQDARISLEKAIRLNPEYVDPYYNLACLFAMTGDGEQGLRYLGKAVSMNARVKEWAAKDPDLEKLRSLPAFGELIK